MKRRACVVLGVLVGAGASAHAATPSPDVRAVFAGLPLHFSANEGQADPSVRFLARGSGYRVLLSDASATLALTPRDGGTADVLRWSLVGAKAGRLEGDELLTGRANYLVGSDPAAWRTGIPLYGRVRQPEVYPGVALAYYGTARQLEYDLEVAPHADPRAIRFRIEGARSLVLDHAGDLHLRTSRGEVVQRAPIAYQTRNGVREPVRARFRRYGDREIGFEVASYDRARPLVIDPVLLWSVYLGSPGADDARGVAVKERGETVDVYVTGTAGADRFNPLVGAGVTGYVAGNDIFVTKLNWDAAAAKLTVVYSTYIGGEGDDQGTGIAVGAQDNAYVCASTTSTAIPGGRTIGTLGQIDAYVAELTAAGDGLVFGVRVGGKTDDIPHGIAVDANGIVYFVGETTSNDYPTAGGPLHGLRGSRNAFASVLNGADQTLGYSTYLGGTTDDRAMGVALDGKDFNVVGITRSSDFDLKAPFQGLPGGGSDAFVTRFTPGTPPSYGLAFSTYLGGSKDDQGLAVAADPSGVYVTGSTGSGDFPVQLALQGGLKGVVNAFVTKLLTDGSKPIFSTYLGGSGSDSGNGIGVDGKGYVYVAGPTSSIDFPVFRPLLPGGDTLQGASDAFLAKIIPTGCSLAYSTHLGGKSDDAAEGAAVTPGGLATIVGRTASPDFPGVAPAAFPGSDTFQGGASDGFAAMIGDDGTPDVAVGKAADVEPAYVNGLLTWTITVTNKGAIGAHDVSVVDTLPTGGAVSVLSVQPGGNCTISAFAVSCLFQCLDSGQSATITIQVIVNPSALPAITNVVTATTPDDPNPANDTAQLVTTVVGPLVDLQVTKAGEATVAVGDQIHYTVTIVNNGPSKATGIVLTDTLPSGTTFVSAPFCSVAGNVVTCAVPDLTPTSNAVVFVTALATSAGIVTNQAQVASTEPDSNVVNNTASFSTTVSVPGGAAAFFTVRSSNAQNLLEWKNPAGPADAVSIHRTTAGPTCAFETNGANSATEIATPAFLANAYDSLVDPQPVTNGTTYCYSLFVRTGGSYSPPRFNRGRPFDSVTGRVRWEFNIGTSSLAPIGNGIGMVHSVSNDGNLYAMVKGAATAGGGRWPQGPPQYLPYPMAGPSQGRPTSVPNPGPPTRVTFLSSTDGTVYAIDAEHGSNGPLLWHSAVLGPMLLAAPSGSFVQFGASRDLVYVGSRDAAGSVLYGLRVADGMPAAPGWSFSGGAFGRIGPVNGQAAVDYATHRVFFASRVYGAPPNNNTLWCVDFETGLPVWARPYGDVDASVSFRGGRLYVATNAGTVLAINASDGSLAWTFTIPAVEGVAKGYVATDLFTQNIYFSTATRVWSLQDTGAGFSDNWPAGGPFPASPSTPVYAPLDTLVYVGSSDGRLYRLNVADGTPFDSFTLGAADAAVGSPTLDLRANYLYVGTEAGRVYAVELP